MLNRILLASVLCVGMSFAANASLPEIPESLYQSRIDLPDDTVYEVVSTQDGIGWSAAIVDVGPNSRGAHFHSYISETYTVLNGSIEMVVDGESTILEVGDTFTVPLGGVHYAHSLDETPARVLVTCVPGWTPDDHHPAEE